MQHPGVAAAWGVEIDPVKCSKGRAYIDLVVRDMAGAGLLAEGAVGPSMVCVPVEQVRRRVRVGLVESCRLRGLLIRCLMHTPLPTRAVHPTTNPTDPNPTRQPQLSTLEPATHAYAAWEGMPRTAKVAFGALFSRAKTLSHVAVAQRAFRRSPLVEMEEMGFGALRLLKTFPVHLAGSQRQLNAYVFVKAGAAAEPAAAAAAAAAGADAAAAAAAQQPEWAAAAEEGADKRKRPAAAGKGRVGSKRAAAAAAESADEGAAGEDASCDTSLPLAQWMRVNRIGSGALSSEVTSRVRKQRRFS
jgi:hypothetical protein